MSAARGLALSALVLAVLLAGYLLLLRGGGGHDYTLVFQTAGQLVKDDDVQVAGRRIGSVRSIELTDDNMAAVEVRVEEPYAPLREGTRAVIRLTSLSGIANRYVALTLAPETSRELDDGATLDLSATTTVVDLDQLFDAIDERTRGDLQDVVKGFATQYEGKGEEAAQSAKYFNPLLSTSRVLASELTEDEGALTRFLVSSSQAVTAIADRRDDLAGLVGNANETAAAIGAENVALSRALELLPTT
ncbi:MAG: MlaD family protein, partial [Solirubrobacteraceae bacterium]